MKQDKIYIVVMAVVFLGLTVLFNFFPKTKYSPLEKRELTQFPKFSMASLTQGKYTTGISSWFSDTEPYRDTFLKASMWLKDKEKISVSPSTSVTFHAAAPAKKAAPLPDERDVQSFQNDADPENAKIAHKGIAIVGSGSNVRALMAYGGGPEGGVAYAQCCNTFAKTLGPGVKVYCMVIPTAIEYYCPREIQSCTTKEQPTISNIYKHLEPQVQAVNVYNALGRHYKEAIYLRTDHHWAPLGAYYAAEQFAKVAKVPFRNLSYYNADTVHRFVGSMYGYSKDIAVKRAPEDFIYYVPNRLNFRTTYVDFQIDKKYNVTGRGTPHKGEFFVKFRDGSSGAYCTFMGVDTRLAYLQTGTKNNRHLLIIKDSFGNALPAVLMYSFETISVVDVRYFTYNLADYVKKNHITDLALTLNVFSAYSDSFVNKALTMLRKGDPAPDMAKEAARLYGGKK